MVTQHYHAVHVQINICVWLVQACVVVAIERANFALKNELAENAPPILSNTGY